MTVPMTADEVEKIIADRKRDFIIMDPSALLPIGMGSNIPIFGIDQNTMAWTRNPPNGVDLKHFSTPHLEEIKRSYYIPLPNLVSYDELRDMSPKERERIARLDGLDLALVTFIFYKNAPVST